MYETKYHRASSLEEARGLQSSGADAKFLSGGMTLIPAMKTRLAAPSDLIDLTRIEMLKGITVSGNEIRIGATTTHYEIATSAEINRLCPALSYMAQHIGDPAVRYRGTIGGSIANNDPAADYPAAMIAMGATILTSKRELAAEDFFTGLFETALEDDEMVTGVRFKVPEKAGYQKFRNPASRYAIVGVYVAKTDGAIKAAVCGAGDNGVFRSSEVEAALGGQLDASRLEGVSIPSDSLMSDMHATADYRANLIRVMAKRAIAAM